MTTLFNACILLNFFFPKNFISGHRTGYWNLHNHIFGCFDCFGLHWILHMAKIFQRKRTRTKNSGRRKRQLWCRTTIRSTSTSQQIKKIAAVHSVFFLNIILLFGIYFINVHNIHKLYKILEYMVPYNNLLLELENRQNYFAPNKSKY